MVDGCVSTLGVLSKPVQVSIFESGIAGGTLLLGKSFNGPGRGGVKQRVGYGWSWKPKALCCISGQAAMMDKTFASGFRLAQATALMAAKGSGFFVHPKDAGAGSRGSIIGVTSLHAGIAIDSLMPLAIRRNGIGSLIQLRKSERSSVGRQAS